MPSAKSLSVARRKKIGSWGGRRKGAGRKRELGLSDRREIAGDYFARTQKWQNNRPLREALIRKLMAKYNVTHRMVARCVAEFLPNIRWNTKMYNHAIEGVELQPLPAGNIKKLKPGVYVEKKLRLVVDSTGKHTWIFRFLWGHTIRDMVLRGPEISLAMARKFATEANRRLAAGQNPIDGSWASAALQSAKSKT
jgi:Arm DNA-binding domain